MIPHHVYYQLTVMGSCGSASCFTTIWPSRGAVSPQPLAEPVPPQVQTQTLQRAQTLRGSYATTSLCRV